MYKAQITAIGSYVPERRLTNDDLEKLVDTNDEWIVQRTGIRERRIVAGHEYTSHLCAAAAQNMKINYNQDLSDVDMIIACTHTPDFPVPGVACQLQLQLGIPHAGAFDLNATCAGFTYGLHMADVLIRSGMHKKVLVVAGDTMSRVTDYTDRTTCILFGDGAGAALVEAGEESSFLGFYLDSDGSGGKHIYRTGLSETWYGETLQNSGKIVQNGREVYKWAVSHVPQGMKQTAAQANVDISSIDWFIPHSANLRMIESICERSGFPLEQTLHSMVYYGNTSSATIPLAMDTAVAEGKISAGDLLLLYGFGGGLVQAGLVLKWTAAAVKPVIR